MPTTRATAVNISESIDALYQIAIISETDFDGNITFASDGFCEISGYHRNELIGSNHRILNSGKHKAEFFKDMWKTILQGQIWHGEVCNRDKIGHYFWVESTIVPVIDNTTKQIKKFISLRIDITEKKLNQLAIDEQFDKLNAVISAFSQGQFDVHIPKMALGFSKLEQAVRTLQDTLRSMSNDTLKLIHNSASGNLRYRANANRYVGGYSDIINGVNAMLDTIVGAFMDDGGAVLTKLAQGEFSARISTNYKGDYEHYKNGINKLATDFQNLIWIKSGLGQLSNNVLAADSLQNQTDAAIRTIASYLNAGKGCLYLYNSSTRKLHLTATYAYHPLDTQSQAIELGEGIIGQVGLDLKPISQTNIHNNLIRTGLAEAPALNSITYPLIFKNELLGVIELASFNLFSENQLKYLTAITERLSSILFGLIQADATAKLLRHSQQQAEELATQRTQLEQNQAGLEAQAQELEQTHRNIQHQNEMLTKSQAEISRQNEELMAANRYKSEFLANMSHELRTPLNSVNILSNILAENRSGNLTPKQIEQAQVIHNSGADLLRMINDILDLSKLESKTTTLSLAPINLSSVLTELHRQFQPIAEERGITFDFTQEEGSIGLIYSDGEKIRQILKNFIANSLKFTDPGGKVWLCQRSAQTLSKWPVSICVKDTGIGIPHSKFQTIFEPFQQVDGSSSRKYPGTGLGLSISQKLATLLDAEITVTSIEQEGSEFCLQLPLAIGDSTAIEESVKMQVFETSFSNSQTQNIVKPTPKIEPDKIQGIEPKKCILIIEDDARFAKILADQALTLGMNSMIAGNGGAGLQLARLHQPIGIILDIHLPGMNGLEILKQLKANKYTQHIPVKVISSDEPNVNALTLGANQCLQKPVSLKELELVLTSLLTPVQPVKKILLVEDDHCMRLMVTELVSSSIENVEINTVITGKEAINSVATEQFDLAIVDLGLPDVSDFSLLQNLKASCPGLPIIIYSGRDFTPEELKIAFEFSESVVFKTSDSALRLIDEIKLFLLRVSNASDSKLLPDNHSNLVKLAPFTTKKVLVVDDDIRNVFATTVILEQVEIDFVTAFNGQEALEQLDKNPDIGLILIDMIMPILNGYETIKMIRDKAPSTKLPIIAITAKAQQEDRQKCLDAGASDYLSKPIETEQLIQLIKLHMANQ